MRMTRVPVSAAETDSSEKYWRFLSDFTDKKCM